MQTVTTIVGGMQAIVGSDHVRGGAGTAAYRLGPAAPQAVVFPTDESEISRVLAFAWEKGLGVVPWGGGAHQSLGTLPTQYDVAIDLGRMDRLLEHEPADMTATAQAGIRVAELQRRLAVHGQFLPLDPPLADRATLGGILATRLSGPLSCRYGTARDLVLGVRVAHADGTITKAGGKVVKNASAYDITKLYLGSYGTLGVIVEATFRLYPRPAREQGWWIASPDLELAQAVAIRILRSHLVPNRVELVDRTALTALAGPAADSALLLSVAGVPEAVQGQGSDLVRIASDFGLSPVEFSLPERRWAALSDFPWVNSGSKTACYRAVWRAIVLPADCAKGMRAVRQATSQWAQAPMVASVAHGALRGAFCADTLEAVRRSLTAARTVLQSIAGILVVLEAPDSLRPEVDMWGVSPDALGVMQRLKSEFDPKRILNAGRLVGGI